MSLLDTVPGRTFVAGFVYDHRRADGCLSLSEFLQSVSMEKLSWEAQRDISGYLYSGGVDDALTVDPTDPANVHMAAAITAELSRPSRETFTSPQHHTGAGHVLRAPRVINRRDTGEVLPDGAFWTSTPVGGGIDTWTYSRETNDPVDNHELHFDPTEIHVARIDSASDWLALLRDHPRAESGPKTLFPDWVSIAESFDAVHLSLLGLLTAHPPILGAAAIDPSRHYARSEAGMWQGVGPWSTVSTAWMVLPRRRRWVHVGGVGE